jgi:hypothetical protein
MPFSQSGGESGDRMIADLRRAAGLRRAEHNALFPHLSALLEQELVPGDAVVFVDDISGTADQALGTWGAMKELIPSGVSTFLILIAATESAINRIETETDLEVIAGVVLGEGDNFFSPRCTQFSEDEKRVVLRSCEKAHARLPRGYGGCGLLVVFQHDCPNNSLPVLWAENRRWAPLFRKSG